MRRKRSRGEWVKICASYEASGEDVATFARGRGVNARTLGWWLGQFRRESSPGRPVGGGFVEVVRAQAAAPVPRTVVRVGSVTVEFEGSVPPVAWVAELAGQC